MQKSIYDNKCTVEIGDNCNIKKKKNISIINDDNNNNNENNNRK